VDYAAFDDEALIRLIAHHRQEALSMLYDRYSRMVFSVAYHATGDQEAAEEITQDVFFRVWDKADTYRAEQARVSTWLTSITRYRSIDFLRRKSVRPEGRSISMEALTMQALPLDEESPEKVAEGNLDKRRVRNALTALSPDQQQALSLSYYQGLSHSEIAALLGEPLGTVKTRIRLAMQKLREALSEDLHIPR
jgi:RNA polymerase sigma-70 factor (ECF subfamily)